VINGTFVSMAGLENIQWENRLAEISLITDREYSHLISDIFQELKLRAFEELNLIEIHTEIYQCNYYRDMWANIANHHDAISALLPIRKYWKGKYYPSIFYSFMRRELLDNENTVIKSTSELN
jgi:hypothetical protein